jgi:hypothetical protein
MTAAINEDSLFAFIIKCSLALLIVLTASGFAFFSSSMGLGVMTGGMIALLNFVWMRNMLQRIIFHTPSNPEGYAQLRFLARLGIIAVALYMIITSGIFSIAGIVIGLSIIVINLIGLSIYFYLRTGG